MKEMLITSSVLIAAIVLLRYIFRSTIPRRVQYALWLLVALRLLVPVSIGNSGWSVAAMAGQLPEREISENILAVVGGDAPDLAPREPDPSLPEAEQQVLYQAYQQEWKDAVERAKIESGGTPITVQSILRIVWFIGMAVMALWFLAANLSFARRLRRTRVPLRGVESRYPVYLCDNIPSPCLFGLFHPAIYVTSAAAKDETRLRYVIAHEETHAQHLDPLWSLVRGVCLVIWWFDPLVWLAAHCAKADCELACDEGTLARLGEVERVPYGETLLSLVPVRRGGNPLLTATTMTVGKRQMKGRIQRIAEHKRPLAIALVVVLALTAIVCAATFTGAERSGSDAAEQIAADLPIAVDGQLDGAYASAEDYIDAVRAKITSATYYAADGSGEKTANVLDTRVALLQKRGEVSDLVPDGTLELYRYRLETKIDVPLADVALAGGMYAAEDGWCDLEGQGGHALIVLRRADGSADVLRDAPCNDDMGGIWHYQDSENEALYDWAVQYYDLDLPLYSVELSLGGQNKAPANRVDGDGWYLYVPVRTWWYREDEGDTARWCSRYNTGSTISIREASREEMKAERPQLAAGQAERFVEAPDGRIWLVWTQYDPSLLIRSDMTGLEPSVLDAMARSFAVDERIHAPARDGVAELRAFAQKLYDEQPDVTLTLFDGGIKGSYPGGGTPNSYHVCYEFINAAYSRVGADAPPADGKHLRLEALGCILDVAGNDVYFRDPDGVARGFRAVGNYGSMEEALRLWYDEAELRSVGGGYDDQESIVIPDRGQGYLAAAQEHCDRIAAATLRVSSGSSFRYTYVKCEVEEAEEETTHFRALGNISENTWAIYMTEIFVPENETALHYGMAGNTMGYAEYVRDYEGEYDPSVPEDACIRWQCGYVTKDADGYHTVLVGTGW